MSAVTLLDRFSALDDLRQSGKVAYPPPDPGMAESVRDEV